MNALEGDIPSESKAGKLAFTQNALIALNEIDRAMAFHMQWLHELHQTLICQKPVDTDMLAAKAHTLCKFGRWYYHASPMLREQEGYAELGERHRVMHKFASSLLEKQLKKEVITLEDYDSFMQSAQAFRNEAHSYEAALINQVCVIDHLTGAWNRYAMLPKINEESERCRRTGQISCLCMLDLDFFKEVNDTHGHLAGDIALRSVARFLSAQVRKYDSIFRFGGEEFLLCLPNTDLAAAEALLERMRVDLAQTDIDLGHGKLIRVTASFGLAELDPQDIIETSLERADHALLCAKAKGRNRVCTWHLNGEGPTEPPR